jgi:hypothetical protein
MRNRTGMRKKEKHHFRDAFLFVTSSGFKPETSTAVMWCSIQLSYEAFFAFNLSLFAGTKIAAFFVSASYFLKLFNLCGDPSV